MQLLKPLTRWFVTQKFGARPYVYKAFGLRGHDGIDLRTVWLDSPLGRRPCLASNEGICEPRWDRTGYGFHVRIHHPDGSMTIYGHLSKILVANKELVKPGQQIGVTGSTGFAAGAHLHFEYRPTGWEKNLNNGYAGAVDLVPFVVEHLTPLTSVTHSVTLPVPPPGTINL